MVESASAKVETTGKATVRVERWPIKTYTWDKPSRYPILFGGGYRHMYPYTMEDRLFHVPVDKVYNEIILENEYIQVIILPELGGHLWRAYDKVSGREIFYNNHVVKPGLISLRGAWCATGVEWNFPIGHTVSTVSTVDSTYFENADGSVSAVVGDLDRTTRMKWTVKITVFPGQLAFRVDTVLSNPTTYPSRYMYWENCAMHATDGFQFIAPAKLAWTWGGKTQFPIIDGVDKSWYISHPRGIDYFMLGLGQDYFGYFDHKRKFGAVHVADYHLMPGKKFFTWGQAEHAKSWAKNLTDDEGPYIELQCGLTPTQASFNFFPPQTSLRWDEVWFSIGDLGYFVNANREAAIHLSNRLDAEPFPETVEVAIVTNRAHYGATVTVSAAGKTLLMKDGVDFQPGKPQRWNVRLPQGARYLDVKLAKGDHVIISYSTREWEEIRELDYEAPRDVSNVEKASPRTRIDAAIADMKWFNFKKAMESIDKALEARPDFTDGHYWKGNLLYNMFKYAEAIPHLSRVTARNANHASAQYLLAEIHRFEGRMSEAAKIARRLAKSEDTAVMGKSLLGRIALQTGKFEKAASLLGEAAAAPKAAPTVMALHAVALRRAGKPGEAEDAARACLAVDPLEYLALNELELLGKSVGRDTIMRGEVESFIELASYYEDMALFEEAAEVLEHYRATYCKDACNPLAYYHLAWANEKLGRKTEAEALYSSAARSSADHALPFRREDVQALEAAIRQNDKDYLAHYLLGCFLAWRLHNDEALAHWTKALEGMSDYPVLLRNLGLYYLQVARDAAKAASFYARATEFAPNDEELYAEADEAFAKLDTIAPRTNSLEKAISALPKSTKIRKLLAQSYYYGGRDDDAIRVLMASELDHWEGDRMGHYIYVMCYLEKGKVLLKDRKFAEALECFQKAMEYPTNLKVGKPAYPRHAPQLYLAGMAYEGLRQADKAFASWKQGGEETHEGWEGSISEEGYYKGLCLTRIGRRREARTIWGRMTKGVPFHWGNTEAYNNFVKALGYQGLAEWDKAEEFFKKALEADHANRKSKYHLELAKEHKQAGV
jgi:tetratricopeptide (TPR) repeat protein